MPVAFITGGTGFLGANLVQQLLDSGQTDIRVLAINSPPELAEKVELPEVGLEVEVPETCSGEIVKNQRRSRRRHAKSGRQAPEGERHA